ncbi:nitrate ABC transporter substrate-binding protein [Candidatus Kaiserbacteria bacterium]|nr:nitrate ABC transporter substrate-binding protein [Candidatus Kaiserbacteria bacterium]
MRMQRCKSSALALLGLVMGLSGAQATEYVQAPPLSSVIKTPVAACNSFRELPVPVIAWGADEANIYANGNTPATASGSIFAQKGLSVRLYREDRLAKQVEDYLSCKTPLLRGTVGMLAQASDVLNADPRTAPVVIFQLSWSEGGDAVSVREGIKEPRDLAGKTVVLQAYGPHVDYLTTILKSAGVPASQVNIKWVKDLVGGDSNPAQALRDDPSVTATFVISPDANALSSGGKVGTGAEDSVRGAHTMLSTKTANRIIADVYAVRRDWYDANPDKVFALVHGMMLGQEATKRLVAEQQQNKRAYEEWTKASAKMLLDNEQAVEDAAGMWADANTVGWKGNVAFFADNSNPRNLSRITSEISEAFVALRLIAKPAAFTPAVLDYEKLSEGLSDIAGVEASRFDQQAVEKLVRERQQQDRLEEGQLFSFEIRFKPNQQGFSMDLYGAEFDRVIELVSTYGGALLTIEGHADTLGYLKRKQNPMATPEELSRMKQGAKNLTLQRANAVRDALMQYAGAKNITLDKNQMSTVGHGFAKPNVSGCVYDANGDVTNSCAPKTEPEWDAMRRVVFRVVSVEAEMDKFQSLDVK